MKTADDVTKKNPWDGFQDGNWQDEIDVRDFILKNYTLYEGDESFLAGATEATKELWDQVMELTKEERERGGVYDLDTKIVSTITSHDAGYLDKEKEKIVGVQTDVPFKRRSEERRVGKECKTRRCH